MSVKISELSASSGLSSTDILPVVDASEIQTQKATFQQVLNYITGSTFNSLTVTSLTASNIVASGSFSGSFVGNGSGLTNLTIPSGSFTLGSTSITLGTTTTTVQGLSVITGSTVTGSIARFTTVSASNAEVSGNLVIYGSASLAEYPDYAYVLYTASYDKIVVYPGLYVSGNLTGSGHASFQAVSGTTAQFTTLSASVVSASSYIGLPTSSGGTPGGTNTTVQFNSGSTFSGSSNLVYDYTNNRLGVGTSTPGTSIPGTNINLDVSSNGDTKILARTTNLTGAAAFVLQSTAHTNTPYMEFQLVPSNTDKQSYVRYNYNAPGGSSTTDILNIRGDGYISINSSGSATSATKLNVNGNTIISGNITVTGSTTLSTVSGTTAEFTTITGSTAYFSGNVGIGVSNSFIKLDMTGTPILDGDNRVILQVIDTTTMTSSVGAGFTFGGKYNSIGTTAAFAGVKGIKENGIDGNLDAALVFMTRKNGVGSIAEKMRITSDGNVGIGTPTPSYKLDVNGPGSIKEYLVIEAAAGANNDSLLIFNARTNGNTNTNVARFVADAATGSSDATFKLQMIDADGGGWDTGFTFQASPAGDDHTYVGIGTTTPTVRLDVAGNGTTAARFSSGAVIVSGNLTVTGTISASNYLGLPSASLDLTKLIVSSSVSLTSTQRAVFAKNNISSSFSITLPSVSTADSKEYYIIKADSISGSVIISGSSPNLINGQSTFELNGPHQSVTLIHDGTDWYVF
jgi:hypothetical protein